MEKITLKHGGELYDNKYPDGIPTTITLTLDNGDEFDSGLVMYPAGHARNRVADLEGILDNKFRLLGDLALEEDNKENLLSNLNNLENLGLRDLKELYNCSIKYSAKSIDSE